MQKQIVVSIILRVWDDGPQEIVPIALAFLLQGSTCDVANILSTCYIISCYTDIHTITYLAITNCVIGYVYFYLDRCWRLGRKKNRGILVRVI